MSLVHSITRDNIFWKINVVNLFILRIVTVVSNTLTINHAKNPFVSISVIPYSNTVLFCFLWRSVWVILKSYSFQCLQPLPSWSKFYFVPSLAYAIYFCRKFNVAEMFKFKSSHLMNINYLKILQYFYKCQELVIQCCNQNILCSWLFRLVYSMIKQRSTTMAE